MSDLFKGARLKIDRADHHIRDLERQFSAFVNTNPYTLAVGSNPETGEPAVLIKFRQDIPAMWALIIGDAIHNLRSSLDHMTWEIIGRDSGVQDRYLKFPTGDNRVNFEASCKGIKTPSQSIKDIFIAMEAFEGGKGNALYALNALDNVEKHAILMPVVRAARINKITVFSPQNTPLVTMQDCTFVGGLGPFATISNIGKGCHVELDNDAKAVPEIFLGKMAANQDANIPLIELLRKLHTETIKAIDFVAGKIG